MRPIILRRLVNGEAKHKLQSPPLPPGHHSEAPRGPASLAPRYTTILMPKNSSLTCLHSLLLLHCPPPQFTPLRYSHNRACCQCSLWMCLESYVLSTFHLARHQIRTISPNREGTHCVFILVDPESISQPTLCVPNIPKSHSHYRTSSQSDYCRNFLRWYYQHSDLPCLRASAPSIRVVVRLSFTILYGFD